MNDIVTTMNSDKVLYGSFGLYPSYVAGILNSVEEIHFNVLCSENLNYADKVEKCIDCKEQTFGLPTGCNFKVVTELRFLLKFSGETLSIENHNFRNYNPN